MMSIDETFTSILLAVSITIVTFAIALFIDMVRELRNSKPVRNLNKEGSE